MTKSKKTRCGPELDRYIKMEKVRRYTTYRRAAVFYSINYYQLVKLAKEANACWKIRKTVMVDMNKLDKYLENFRDREGE